MQRIKSNFTLEKYKEYVNGRGIKKKTLVKAALEFLGPEYYDLLRNLWGEDIIYNIFFGSGLAQINMSPSDDLWDRFVETDLLQMFKMSQLVEIQLFIRNILFHGFSPGNQKDIFHKLFDKEIQDVISAKFEETSPDSLYYFMRNLMYMAPALFNRYFEEVNKTSVNIYDPFSAEITRNFLLLVYCYYERLDVKSFIDDRKFRAYSNSLIAKESIRDKISLSSMAEMFNVNYTCILTDGDRNKILHFFEGWILEKDKIINKSPAHTEMMILETSSVIIGIIRNDPRFTELMKKVGLDN